MSRPSTSKPRGLCQYYNSPRGCFQGDRCKFLHGKDQTLTPYDKSKVCKFFTAGYCKRGAECWFKHILPHPAPDSPHAPPPLAEEDAMCGICYEIPSIYGLLSDCGHVFCLECLRSWRDREKKSVDVIESGVNKKCPYCRTASKLITPSSHFYPHGHPGKAAAIQKYKESLSRVPCEYFKASKPNDRYCPFGRDCFYQHQNPDGSPYVFKYGVKHYMPQLRRRHWVAGSRSADVNGTESFGRFASSFEYDTDLYMGDLEAIMTLQAELAEDGHAAIESARGRHQLGLEFDQYAVNLSRSLNIIRNAVTNRSRSVRNANVEGPAPDVAAAAVHNPSPSTAANSVTEPITEPDLDFFHLPRPASVTSTGSYPSLETVSDSSDEDDPYPFFDSDDEVPTQMAGFRNRDEASRLVTAMVAVHGAARRRWGRAHDPRRRAGREPPQPRADDAVAAAPNIQASAPEVVDPGMPYAYTGLTGLPSAPEELQLATPSDPVPSAASDALIPPAEVEVLAISTDAAAAADGGAPTLDGIPPSAVEMAAPGEPTRDAESPFMTDGRGRVVWSNTGSKSSGPPPSSHAQSTAVEPAEDTIPSRDSS